MDSWLSRRAADPRFQNERRVTGTSQGNWYLAGHRFQRESHTFSASEYKSGDTSHKMTPHKGDGPEKTIKKKKKRKSGEAFTESEKKKLENRTSSDDSDGGPCWSDYERVPGTKAGEKGSCRPKGGKKD